jgi:hypothetical protein
MAIAAWYKAGKHTKKLPFAAFQTHTNDHTPTHNIAIAFYPTKNENDDDDDERMSE